MISLDSFAKKLTDDTLHVEICKKIEDTDNEIKELSAKGLQTDDLANKCKALEDENKKVSDELEALKAEKAKLEYEIESIKKQALEMLQITLSNQRKVNEEWKAI